ncbi:MAG: UPF0147 family protein [Candidatus Thermoplasmatota archaeon]|jgi:uncharacterized protein (UPF0147 family)|uniref:UPF0147 family protein n=1 Tax=Ferroplasma sp. TaxID=2591003 RepID=UPI000389554B|nr:UPF0147 family protein [Ferroplasma sp.]EQB70297.1 MAG: hypothetical protein AMDU4_FER2C00247G0012 [Ferroplasma sp. Type II]MCL4311571.1 UPF0147 family protein [Candidatus Thermoplasmatota archaeon]HII82168.1 UPF0147 family protein [Ferroplasma sp.]
MDENLFNEVLALMDELEDDSSIPRNVRKTSSEAKEKMKDNKESLDLRCATVISELDDISNDPNVPSHGRAAIYTIISKLEALSKS